MGSEPSKRRLAKERSTALSVHSDVDAWAAHRAFLPIYRYCDIPQLIVALDAAVITPVEQFVRPRPIVERPS